MNKVKFIRIASAIIIGLTATAVLMVSAQAFVSPQSVMDLVGVQLSNTDAYSSIRGVYGGIGFLIFIQLVYLLFKNQKQGLIIVALFGGLYALSRTITIFAEGSLGTFGTQWLMTEAVLCVLALLLLFLRRRVAR
jgi:Domain of unknown function (DUF4345)